MSKTSCPIFIFCGEQSADLHGAKLAKSLRESYPQLEIFGVGGRLLEESGVNLIRGNHDLGVVGLLEVIKQYSKFKQLMENVCDFIHQKGIKHVILLDYPGFNLRLAKRLAPLGIRVYYYISPQVWAWGKKRIKIIKKFIYKLYAIFDFEKDFFMKNGVNVAFFGHPLLDELENFKKEHQVTKTLQGLQNETRTITLLPGSRQSEVQRLFRPMLEACKNLCKSETNIRFFISISSKEREKDINTILSSFDLGVFRNYFEVFQGSLNELLNLSDIVLTASGTACLQAALFHRPMVVVYKINPISYEVLSRMVRLKYYSLVNIIADELVVAELMQKNFQVEKMTEELKKLLDPQNYYRVAQKLKDVHQKLGEPGASIKVASDIGREINESYS